VEAVEDFTWAIRRVLEDGTAEIRFTGKWTSDRWSVSDTTESDSVIHHETTAPEFLRYAKPNGKTVDIQLVSDTSQAEEAYLRHHFEQSYAIFPDQPIGPGYTWTQSTKVILPEGPTDATATYTVKGYDRVGGHDCVIIEYDNLAIIPLLPRTSERGELLEGVHRIRSVGDLSFAYREGYEVQVKERWTLNGDYQFIKKGQTDTLAIRELVEYDVEADLTDVRRQ
jgi:hypothetical protein